ncbi:MAG: AI-2E family transporter [Epsilonproteobacteria bacterium]|nr:AI-2E family transporter [Campylobacterota bacterium]
MKAQHFIVLLLAVSGWFMFQVYRPFMQDIAIAVLLMLATMGIAKPLWKRLGQRWQVSAVMTLLLAAMFFAPLVYMINAIARMLTHLDPDTLHALITKTADYLRQIPLPADWLARFGIETGSVHDAVESVISEENIARTVKNTLSFFGTLAAHSAVFFKDMLLILVFYFFSYLYGEKVGHAIKRILPLNTAQTQLLFNELHNSMGVVFFSILATAIFEGALFALIVSFYGLDAILLGILYGFASLVPVVGGALMWVPTALYLWVTQGAQPALVVTLYSLIVISVIADTFIKPVIIREIDIRLLKETNAVSEVLVFFSIIAGLTTYGFWGMIIGPAITTAFLAILKLYEEFQAQNQPLTKGSL